MIAIEKVKPSLKDVLPKDYGRPALNAVMLGELIDLISGIGPMISTAMVAAIGKGEAFDRGLDFAAWVGLVPTQYSTGGRTIL